MTWHRISLIIFNYETTRPFGFSLDTCSSINSVNGPGQPAFLNGDVRPKWCNGSRHPSCARLSKKGDGEGGGERERRQSASKSARG